MDNKKKLVFDSEVMALPPLRLVIGDIPVPDPDRHGTTNLPLRKPGREVELSVKRIIAHLEQDK